MESRIDQAIQHLAVLVGTFIGKHATFLRPPIGSSTKSTLKRTRRQQKEDVILTGVRAEIAASIYLSGVNSYRRYRKGDGRRRRIEGLLNALVKTLEVKTHGTDVTSYQVDPDSDVRPIFDRFLVPIFAQTNRVFLCRSTIPRLRNLCDWVRSPELNDSEVFS